MTKMSELRTVDVKNAKWVTFAEMRANAAAKAEEFEKQMKDLRTVTFAEMRANFATKAEEFEKQMKDLEKRDCFVCSKPAPDGMVMFQSGEALVVHEKDCLARLKSS
jgi:hypothetical protein